MIQQQELNKSLYSISLIWHTGMYAQISHHSGKMSLNYVVDVEELIFHTQE